MSLLVDDDDHEVKEEENSNDHDHDEQEENSDHDHKDGEENSDGRLAGVGPIISIWI